MGKDLAGRELGKGFSQKADGRYVYRFTNRFGKRISKTNANLNDLKCFSQKENAKDVLKLNSDTDAMFTLDYVYNLWINVYRKEDLKESTQVLYKTVYNRNIKPSFLSSMPIGRIKPLDIKMFYNTLVNQYSQSICGTIRAILLGIFDLAVLQEYVPFNPILSMKIKSKKQAKVIKALTREEQELFLKYLKDDFYFNAHLLLLSTGIRAGELCGLRISDIDLKNKYMTIKRTLHYQSSKGTFKNGSKYMFSTPKSGRERVVPLNETAYRVITRQMILLTKLKMNALQTNNEPYQYYKEYDNLLFLERNGRPLNQSMIRNSIYKACDKIKKNDIPTFERFGIHVLRHTFATRCKEMNIDYEVIKSFLGHKNVSTTMNVYVSDTSDNQLEINKLDSIFKIEQNEEKIDKIGNDFLN